jgi:hypothetical protein
VTAPQQDVHQVTASASQDRLLRVVVIGTALATMVVAAVGLLTYTRASTAADSSAVVREGSDIQGCRSLARTPLDEARTEMEALILTGLSASARDDGEQMLQLLIEADAVVGRLQRAQADLDAAIDLSVSDPDAFLAGCRAGNPTPTTEEP